VWRYVYRAVDHGQEIDLYVTQRRDIASARTFFTAVLAVHGDPGEVIPDRAPASANVIEELIPAALHNTGQYENNRAGLPVWLTLGVGGSQAARAAV
jgi:transposase-like protein